jgi:hypothetical protein
MEEKEFDMADIADVADIERASVRDYFLVVLCEISAKLSACSLKSAGSKVGRLDWEVAYAQSGIGSPGLRTDILIDEGQPDCKGAALVYFAFHRDSAPV